ncbi:MAG: hypothetical protein Q8O37_05985 [Sulfuricellaceae bacterium]|nr:hypothetical protein [Sulfuricellaceae bacterium]
MLHMGNLLGMSFLFVSVITGTCATADSWKKMDGWGTAKDIAETNKSMRTRAEVDEKETIIVRKEWESEAPAREARQKEREMWGITLPDRKTLKNSMASAIELDNPPEKLVNDCVEMYRNSLKDPRSPYVVGAKIERRSTLQLIVDARAKNSFGGYISTEFICDLNSSDSIDIEGTKLRVAFSVLGMAR